MITILFAVLFTVLCAVLFTIYFTVYLTAYCTVYLTVYFTVYYTACLSANPRETIIDNRRVLETKKRRGELHVKQDTCSSDISGEQRSRTQLD